MSQYKKKNLLIGGLLAIVVVMGIAYAAFASNLNITGTSSTTNNWGVRITSITPDKNAGGTSPNYTSAGSISQSYTDLTATFSAALISPGDTVTYTITVENYGSLDAKLDSITMPESSNPAISFSKAGIAVGDVITAGQTGNTKTFTVTVTYVDSPNQGQPASTTSNFTLTLNFVQNDGNGGGGNTPAPTTQTVYSWNTTAITVGTSQLTDLVSTKTTNPYYTSEADIQSALSGKTNSTFYNKYTVEGDTITEGYACQTFGILSRAECLKMSTDGSEYGYDAGGNHTKNAGILKALLSNSTFTGASGSCYFHSSNSYCYVGDLNLHAYPGGDVGAYDYAYDYGTGARCYVYNEGSAYCRG